MGMIIKWNLMTTWFQERILEEGGQLVIFSKIIDFLSVFLWTFSIMIIA